MRFVIAAVTPRKQKLKSSAAQELAQEFVKRSQRYAPVELRIFDSEAQLLAAAEHTAGRTAPQLVLLDSRGELSTSEDLATRLGKLRDSGVQQLMLAIGPADGWSSDARQRAAWVLSLGRLTLPHELALVVLSEQVYRTLTILAGHPYHGGH